MWHNLIISNDQKSPEISFMSNILIILIGVRNLSNRFYSFVTRSINDDD